MKKLLSLLALTSCISSLNAIQPVVNQFQQHIGNVKLHIENKTNNNYRITTSQQLVPWQEGIPGPQLTMLESANNPNSIDTGIRAAGEKDIAVSLVSMEPNNPRNNYFNRYIYIFDTEGNVKLELRLTEFILDRNANTAVFRLVLEHLPTEAQIEYEDIGDDENGFINLTLGKANFSVKLVLKGDDLEQSTASAAAIQ